MTFFDLFQNYPHYCFIDIQISWLLILCIPLLENPFQFLQFRDTLTSKKANFRASKHSHNSQFLGFRLTAWRCVVDIVLSYMEKIGRQNFPYFNTCRFMNDKISGFLKSTYEELLLKILRNIEITVYKISFKIFVKKHQKCKLKIYVW